MLEKKNGGSIKDVNLSDRIVTGYLSKFRTPDNPDFDNDIFLKGAWKKTISERKDDIFFLNQHNWAQPLGKFNTLLEDERGLYFEAGIVDTTFGNDQLKLYDAGVVTQHSVGFETIQKKYLDRGVRAISEARLWEGSAVTLGADNSAEFTGFKSQLKQTNKEIKNIMKALRVGDLTDETYNRLELGLKILQTKAYELGKQHSKDSEPPAGTQSDFEPLSDTFKSLTL